MDFDPYGEWGRVTTSARSGAPAVYENPGDGFGTGCTTWATMQDCAAAFAPGSDLKFALVKK